MNEINFTSTYQFPTSQPHVNRATRAIMARTLRRYKDFNIVTEYKMPQHSNKNGRVSVPEEFDNVMEWLLRRFHFRNFKKFPMHAASIEKFDTACPGMIRRRVFEQFGPVKNKAKQHAFRYNKNV